MNDHYTSVHLFSQYFEPGFPWNRYRTDKKLIVVDELVVVDKTSWYNTEGTMTHPFWFTDKPVKLAKTRIKLTHSKRVAGLGHTNESGTAPIEPSSAATLSRLLYSATPFIDFLSFSVHCGYTPQSLPVCPLHPSKCSCMWEHMLNG